METDGDKTDSGPSRDSVPGGNSMDNMGRGAVNIKPVATSVTPAAAGSCPSTSLLMSGRASSPSPAIHRPRACPSPLSSIVGTALNQYVHFTN